MVSPSVADLVPPDGPFVNYYAPDKNVKHYTGEGIAIRSLSVEGPLAEPWPPASAQLLLPGVEFADGAVRLNKAPREHVREVVAAFATRAFRRPLGDEEVRVYIALAEPALAAERPFLEVVRVPLLAILTSPSFLYQSGPPGELDDYALATRLSYFLWRSMPDAALVDAAATGRLSEPTLLAEQVDRLLDDPKSERFNRRFRRPGIPTLRTARHHAPTPPSIPIRRAPGPGDGGRDRAVPCRIDRRELKRRQPDRFRLHVPQPTLGRALRHRRRGRSAHAQGGAAGRQQSAAG